MNKLAVLSVLFLFGCSASWHYRTALRKDPSLIVRDTIVKYDTIIVEVAKVDTIFKYKMDTVTYWQDSIFVKYHYSYKDSLVYIEVDCPDEKEIIRTEYITNTITLEPTLKDRFKIALYSIGALIIIAFLFRMFRR